MYFWLKIVLKVVLVIFVVGWIIMILENEYIIKVVFIFLKFCDGFLLDYVNIGNERIYLFGKVISLIVR